MQVPGSPDAWMQVGADPPQKKWEKTNQHGGVSSLPPPPKKGRMPGASPPPVPHTAGQLCAAPLRISRHHGSPNWRNGSPNWRPGSPNGASAAQLAQPHQSIIQSSVSRQPEPAGQPGSQPVGRSRHCCSCCRRSYKQACPGPAAGACGGGEEGCAPLQRGLPGRLRHAGGSRWGVAAFKARVHEACVC